MWLRQQKDRRGKFTRWLLELESLNYSMKYRRGIENLAADYLSRSDTSFDSDINNEYENLERHVYQVKADLQGQDGLSINCVSEELASSQPRTAIVLESPLIRSKLQEAQNSDQVISDAIRQLKSKDTVEDGQLKISTNFPSNSELWLYHQVVTQIKWF